MKVAYLFESEHAREILENMIIPQLEKGTHVAEVAGMMFFFDNCYMLVQGERHCAASLRPVGKDRNAPDGLRPVLHPAGESRTNWSPPPESAASPMYTPLWPGPGSIRSSRCNPCTLRQVRRRTCRAPPFALSGVRT